MADLIRSITAIIENPVPGIYNLASFSETVKNISNNVAKQLNSKIKYIPDTLNNYNFNFSVEKFVKTYNFEFHETIGSIVEEIINNKLTKPTFFSNRNNFKNYE
jgi:hypothetical protein